MTKAHPLIDRALKYPVTKVRLSPDGCFYDKTVGAWKLQETGQLWVETNHRNGPRTKKADIETGEDQKGE